MLKFLDKEIICDEVKTVQEFVSFLLNEAENCYYYPFEWAIGEFDLEIEDIVRSIFDEVASLESYVYKYGKTDESSNAIETVVYQLPSDVQDEYFEDGVYVSVDTPKKIAYSKQQVKYYRYDGVDSLEDSPQILLFDINECNFDLFSLLLPKPIFVQGEDGKVYAIFSGYLN